MSAANRNALFDIPCVDSFADLFPCGQVDLLAFLPYTEMGGDTNNTLWGWTDPMTGKEYTLVGARNADQATHNAGAMKLKLSDEERATIRAAFDDASAKMSA